MNLNPVESTLNIDLRKVMPIGMSGLQLSGNGTHVDVSNCYSLWKLLYIKTL